MPGSGAEVAAAAELGDELPAEPGPDATGLAGSWLGGLSLTGLSDAARQRGTLTAVALALFCIQLDFFALTLALPAMAHSFAATPQAAQWTLSGYMLSLGALFIVAGRVGDIIGRRRAFLLGCVLFTGTMIGAALAPSLAVLVLFRVLQGAGAGLVFPVGIALVTNGYPEARRAKALGLTFALANIGTAVGPFVGGWMAEGPGWRWIFWLLVPVSTLAAVATLRYVPESRDETAPRQIDVPGAAIVAAGVAAVSFGVDRATATGWSSGATIGFLAAGIALLAAFPLRERRTAHPLIDLSLFRNLPFDLVTFLGTICNVCYAVTIFVVSLYLQNARGLSPIRAGLVFLGLAVLVAMAGPIGARLQPHFRPTVVMAGAGAIAGLSLVLLTNVTSWWAYVPVFAVCGFGLGLGWTFANIATQEVVDPGRAGEASGVVLTFLVTFGGIGLAAAASIISALEHAGRGTAGTYETTLRVFAFLSLGASLIVMVIRQILVRQGLMKPLSMAADGAGDPAALDAGGADGADAAGR
jgi:EmrB/QacA subfamily drug resistance transporter